MPPQLLLDKGATMMAKTGSGSTAFSLSAEGGRVEVVRLFMERATAATTLDALCNEKVREIKQSGFDDILRI